MCEHCELEFAGRRRFLRLAAGAAIIAAAGPVIARGRSPGGGGNTRSLSFVHLHTGETLEVTYWHNGRYITSAQRAISELLRDHRNGQKHSIDPKLLDALHRLKRELALRRPFHIISGYRSPETNEKLRRMGRNVARRSLHTQGKAIDIRVPGRDTAQLRQVALNMRAGGVGYYPNSDFVHIDTGRVRQW